MSHSDVWWAFACRADDPAQRNTALDMIGLDGSVVPKVVSVGPEPSDLDVGPDASRLSVIARGKSKIYADIPSLGSRIVITPGSFIATVLNSPIGRVRVWSDQDTLVEFAAK